MAFHDGGCTDQAPTSLPGTLRLADYYGTRAELPFDVQGKRHPVDYTLDPNVGRNCGPAEDAVGFFLIKVDDKYNAITFTLQ